MSDMAIYQQPSTVQRAEGLLINPNNVASAQRENYRGLGFLVLHRNPYFNVRPGITWRLTLSVHVRFTACNCKHIRLIEPPTSSKTQRCTMAKILIVDDNNFFRRMLCKSFSSQAEFEVCGEGANGREAVEKALKLHPDVIVLDVLMPIMNGLDAARILRMMMPGVPIIMNSAMQDPVTERQARVFGVDEITPKSAPVLIQKARQLLYSDQCIAA